LKREPKNASAAMTEGGMEYAKVAGEGKKKAHERGLLVLE